MKGEIAGRDIELKGDKELQNQLGRVGEYGQDEVAQGLVGRYTAQMMC